jgi:single-stranded DNA-binding protein
MRDLNSTTLSGTVVGTVRSFGGDGTPAGCEFSLCVHDEWRNGDGTISERDDFFGIVCYGPNLTRALTLTGGERLLVTGKLRSEEIPRPNGRTEKKTKVRADHLEHLRRISHTK